jgi:hypothetical protein
MEYLVKLTEEALNTIKNIRELDLKNLNNEEHYDLVV